VSAADTELHSYFKDKFSVESLLPSS